MIDTAFRDDLGQITDVAGIRVGNVSRVGGGYLTGVTAVLPPPRTVAAVDVRGGGPGTHETDALDPRTLVPSADAIVLTGGSAYGLVATHGAQLWCEQHGRGFPVGTEPNEIVPIVPGAAIFDLGRGGGFTSRPTSDWGYEALQQANASGDFARIERGNIGAGTGAVTSRGRLKGGLGTGSVSLTIAGVTYTVGALAIVNARGVPQMPGLEELSATQYSDESALFAEPQPLNTTIAVVATDAKLDVAETARMASCAHDGFARALDPVHTLSDGDTVFGLATGDVDVLGEHQLRTVTMMRIQAAAADAMAYAIVDAVLNAESVETPNGKIPSYAEYLSNVR
ncbi:P1 family peptidase [Gordonia jinhuaensis]|uniref:L-aminopeptidase/D-esterase n=1 Tax=Gordonia jinhuaensis TaxID=1517702 RepID=A0A916WXZ9_9ACTN|nr:P1 family peptidase [Gordonia jinhuaensis]GGB38455.1 hypothetical protein GCM10011489_27670 [Gordonia jinhuaensis]